jgi:sugar/nucleoside kinase (ribokinase family)
MHKDQASELQTLSERLLAKKSEINSLKAVVGLDGFIDRISRVVSSRTSRDSIHTFETIKDFSKTIGLAAGKSAQYELDIYAVKPGGNAPIMSLALSEAGVMTTCLGTLGYPTVHENFEALNEKVNVMSFANPGVTNAFEFDDGKLMFADFSTFKELDWEQFKSRIPLEKLRALVQSSRLLALVDWSNIFGIEEIWQGLLTEVVAELPSDNRPEVFFDLADPSARDPKHVRNALSIIQDFSNHCPVTLGLNLNEAEKILKILRKSTTTTSLPDNLAALAQELFDLTGVGAVVVHPRDRSVIVTSEGTAERRGRIIEHPKISTGGGDNFNAGYCLGRILQFSQVEAIELGMATSGAYVTHGKSPTLDELAEYLGHWSAEIR